MRDDAAGSAEPDPRRVHTLAELSRELELLRALAARGSHKQKISLAELAKRVGEPRSTIHAYVTGRYLAPLDVLDRIVAELGAGAVELREWSEAWFRVADAQEVKKQARSAAEDHRAVPRELPPDVAAFTGRVAELDELDHLLARSEHEPSAVVISAVAGTAGVGKTALAVRWGHSVAGAFPNGCLYVDLRGYDPFEPVRPEEALAGFLRALGVAGADIPYEPARRAAMYRTLLDGRRMLIVLDNARDTEQVRLLLPGSASCFVIVTSRNRLAGLVSRYGASRIDVDLLPPTDAAALLRRLVGPRVDADPAAAGQLTNYCAYLPLALRIAAELAVARPAVTLADLADELADEHRKLELLQASDDPRTAVRMVFSWSYEHLLDNVARTFRLLGLHPGTDITASAAARLAEIDGAHAKRVLDTLADAHLVRATMPGRYGMHDLLRTWARECAQTQETVADRQAALTRLFDHYLHTSAAAVDMLYPHERNLRPAVAVPETATVADETSARQWLATERANLLAVTTHAAKRGWPRHALQLSATLHRHLYVVADFTAAQTMHEHALEAAIRHGDRGDQARALHNLGSILASVARYDQAVIHLHQALALHRDVGDRTQEARALSNLGTAYWRSARYEPAADHLRQAVAIYHEVNEPAGEIRALLNLAATFWRSGHYRESADRFQQALDRCEGLGIREGQVLALGGLGAVHCSRGRHELAIDVLDRACALAAEIGDRFGESIARTHLGVAHGRTGSYPQAVEHLERSVTLWRASGDQNGQADALSKLADLYNLTGRHELAATCHNEALRLFRACGDRTGLAMAWNGLGETADASGDPARALRAHEQATDLAGQIGDRVQLARAHRGAGHALYALGNRDRCCARWRQALAIYDELGIPEAEEIRTRLAGIDTSPGR